MKIGASTLAGIENDLEEILDFIEGLGIEYAELVHQYPFEDITTDITDSYKLKYSIHAPFMDVNPAALQKSSRINSIEQTKRSIDLACEINAEAVVVHPGRSTFLANKYFPKKVCKTADESMAEIGEYGRDLGIMVAFENMPAFEGMLYQDMDRLDEFLTSHDLSMTLDIGHANHVGYAPQQMYFDSIKHIHIHDNFGDDDSHLALGEGSIELNEIVNILEKNNYDGIYILEVNDADSIKKSFEYMKKNF